MTDTTAQSGHVIVEISDLTAGYGKSEVLHGVNMQVGAGEIGNVEQVVHQPASPMRTASSPSISARCTDTRSRPAVGRFLPT